jgi:hypothetical protein
MARLLQFAQAIVVAVLFVLAAVQPALAQFETRASASTSTYVPYSLVAGDFNRDSKLDVAVVSYLPSGNVTIFLGNGDGTFRAGESYPVAVQPFYAATASSRNNGILDLVVGDSLSDDVYVMLGNGDGTFLPPVAYPTTARPGEVSVGDFTGTGKIDILALEGTNTQGVDCNCVEVLPGNGDGTFGAPITTPLPYGMSGYAFASADLNHDGKLDVAVVGESLPNEQAAILLGNGDGTFRADGYYLVSAEPVSVVTGRFSGDRKIDLAVGNLLGNSISVLLGNGNGKFQQAVNYETWFPTWVAVGDLNGDGKEDLVAANVNSPNLPGGSISMLVGNGDGTFQSDAVFPAGLGLNYVVIGDFNGDGKPDLAAADRGGAVITLLNTGIVTFSPTTPITFPTQLLGTTGAPLSATLANDGTSPLAISSVSYSGEPFHVQTTCKGSLAPAASCTITATFTAQTVGVTTGTITIHDSASSKPQVVELVGTATEAKFSPAQLTFSPQKNGTKSPSQDIQLTNIGSSPFTFTRSIYIGGTDFTSFFESNNCPTTLNGGASCSIHVIFAPRKTGSLSGSVIVYDSGGGSPQSIPLSGTGD